MHRRHALLAIVAVFVLGASAPALAGKGTSTAPSSIAIASVNGTQLSASTQQPTPALSDTLTFATSVGSLAGWEYPMVDLTCYQDVNGDGVVNTSIAGPDLVFSWLDKPSATFTLGGYSSIWTQRGGGPAVCRADLDAYGWKAGKESIRVLASTGDFNVSG